MRKTTLYAVLATACMGLASLPDPVQAQNRIICESQLHRRTECEADTRGGVMLITQRSNAACVQDRTWGFAGNRVWVSDGCRASFTVDIPAMGSGSVSGPPPGVPISEAEAVRACRNTVATRMAVTDPGSVRVDIFPPDDQLGRSVGWVTSDGRSGSCRVSVNGEVTGLTVSRTPSGPPSGVPISEADAVRICRDTVVSRLGMTDPGSVRVDIFPPDDQLGRSVSWVTSDGRAGSCRVSANGEVTGLTVKRP